MRSLIKNLFSVIIFFTAIITHTASFSIEIGDFKNKAIEAFKNEDYKKAVEILKVAVESGFEDAETYYYLGYFTHYMLYDSKPLIKENHIEYSNNVIEYLEKALALDPDFRNAYSFIGIEYGARAMFALYQENKNDYINFYRMGYEKGGFPDWQIEFGRNILKSCEINAIVFLGGDFDYNAVRYLQTVENYRSDVTAIPIGHLDRPWFVKILKNGYDPLVKKAPISLSKYDIDDMRNYKWDTLQIEISVNKMLIEEYGFEKSYSMKWKLEPDLKSERRTYLSPRRAILADIVFTNKFERPIHFSYTCLPKFRAGLDNFLQVYGMTYKLLPFKTKETNHQINPDVISRIMLNKENFAGFKTIETKDIPRDSYVLNNYYQALIQLAIFYQENNQKERLNDIINFIENHLTTSKLGYDRYLEYLKELNSSIN
ncbi:MAG: hypothetical protein M0Q45_11285 [Bacteroidales bacterium]|nr:hypothetical protein [Bacteroidales bacterium]